MSLELALVVSEKIQEVALSPDKLQYIEMVQVMQRLGVIQNNYQRQLDEQSILEMQDFWNEAGGQQNMFIQSDKFIFLVVNKYGAQLSKQETPMKQRCRINLTLKSHSRQPSESFNKENVPSFANSCQINEYVSRRVNKIREDFLKTSKPTPLTKGHRQKYY